MYGAEPLYARIFVAVDNCKWDITDAEILERAVVVVERQYVVVYAESLNYGILLNFRLTCDDDDGTRPLYLLCCGLKLTERIDAGLALGVSKDETSVVAIV